MKQPQVQSVLRYKCYECGKIFDVHIHGEFYEAKQLFCANDGNIMMYSFNKVEVKDKCQQ